MDVTVRSIIRAANSAACEAAAGDRVIGGKRRDGSDQPPSNVKRKENACSEKQDHKEIKPQRGTRRLEIQAQHLAILELWLLCDKGREAGNIRYHPIFRAGPFTL